MATAAAHGLSSFSSYQCAAVVKAVSSVATATHAVAVTVAATTPAVASKNQTGSLPFREASFLYKTKCRVKNINIKLTEKTYEQKPFLFS